MTGLCGCGAAKAKKSDARDKHVDSDGEADGKPPQLSADAGEKSLDVRKLPEFVPPLEGARVRVVKVYDGDTITV